MRSKKWIVLIFTYYASIPAQAQNKDSLEVLKATQVFLKAFKDFDWQTFRNCFSSGATVFYPTWEQGKRRTGQKEVEAAWTEIFPEFIDSTKKFKLEINPTDMFVQLYGLTAILTFHFGEGNFLSRRTIVYAKEKDKWKIVHLHASNLRKEKDNQ